MTLITQIKGKRHFEVWSKMLFITPFTKAWTSLDRNSSLDWIWLVKMGEKRIFIALLMSMHIGDMLNPNYIRLTERKRKKKKKCIS